MHESQRVQEKKRRKNASGIDLTPDDGWATLAHSSDVRGVSDSTKPTKAVKPTSFDRSMYKQVANLTIRNQQING